MDLPLPIYISSNMGRTTDHHTERVRVKSKHSIHITHKGLAYDIEGTILGGRGTSRPPI